MAPVNRTVRMSDVGVGSEGASSSVAASMNLSSVNSSARTSVEPAPWTAPNVDLAVADNRCASM